MDFRPTLQEIQAARERIAPYIRRTPLLCPETLGKKLGCQAYLKPEMLQPTGSFKLRGAMNKALQLSPEERAHGMIASSSGNHAQALAYAGKHVGAHTIIVAPADAPQIKLQRARELGAEVHLSAGSQRERWAYVDQLIEANGYTMVHASEDPAVMAGQGTMALEILEDLPQVDTIVIPMGGGGLVSGIAIAAKSVNPKIRIIGVEPAAAPKYWTSRKAGRPTVVSAGKTIADGVREEIPGKNAYPIIEEYVDEIALAEEWGIAEGLRLLAQDGKVFAEGAAAVGIGAVLSGSIRVRSSEAVCFILSGGNWELDRFFTVCGIKKEGERT